MLDVPTIILDIETAPHNYGECMERNKTTDQLEDVGALSPITGRVTAIGTTILISKQQPKTHIFMDQDEKLMLSQFWTMLKALGETRIFRIVGFNIHSFDMPFLIVRSLANGVGLSYYNKNLIQDLRKILAFNQPYKKGKLDDYAKMMGIEGKYKGMDGFHACQLWKDKQYDELRAYLTQDLVITQKLWETVIRLRIYKDQ